MRKTFGANKPELEIVRGSVIDQEVDYIVNAANTLMRGGGGVDGAIHAQAGRQLLLELQRVAPRSCETGKVVVTSAYDLPYKGIIHTPGPIWRGGDQQEADLLAACYRNSLNAAHERSAESIAFCSISTGSYRFPLDDAASIAVATVIGWISAVEATSLRRIVFAMRGQDEFQSFTRAVSSISRE